MGLKILHGRHLSALDISIVRRIFHVDIYFLFNFFSFSYRMYKFNGMYHKLPPLFLYLCMITFWFFIMFIFSCLGSILHPPLYNFLSDTSAPEFRSRNMCNIFSHLIFRVGLIIFPPLFFPPFGRHTLISSYPFSIFVCFWLVFSVRWIIVPKYSIDFLVGSFAITMILTNFFWLLPLLLLFTLYFFVFYFSSGQTSQLL